MRLPDELTISWRDGFAWTVDATTFGLVTARLAAVRDVVWGLGPILDRWNALAARFPVIAVDDLAPSEDERAILTAALARAVDDARALGPEPLGIETAADYTAFLGRIERLHELFMTDITRNI